MGTPVEFAQWYYLIYLLPGGMALLLLLLSAAGGGHHHVGVGHHAGVGTGPHAGGLGHAHGGGTGHGFHHSGHQSGGAHPGATHSHAPTQSGSANDVRSAPTATTPGLGQQVLGYFGIGRLPAPFIWGSFLLGWGLFGFWGTQFWQEHLHFPALFALPALAVAVVGALATSRITAAVGGRLLPQDESYATSPVELYGQTGTVVYPVDTMRGRVHVYDAHGTLHEAAASVLPGQSPIARGRTVRVNDYDAVHDRLIVEEVG